MNNIKMKITTVQTVDDAGNEDIIELVTEASMEHEHDYIIVNYDESDITESKGTRTRLKIYKDRLIVTKVGTLSSRMEFEENKSYSNLYTTPYGNFDLNFNTIAYKNGLDEHGKGTISIEYRIIFSGSEESYNKMIIDIF
ncbi:MAG TPA: hypothetical protein DC038_03660 [Clostridiales bacterium]|nr:hypothetical protein [Clostridiales bacterium]